VPYHVVHLGEVDNVRRCGQEAAEVEQQEQAAVGAVVLLGDLHQAGKSLKAKRRTKSETSNTGPREPAT
jgi:hypothetical protein